MFTSRKKTKEGKIIRFFAWMLMISMLPIVVPTALCAGDGDQLKLEWYLETPANENHMFRGIAINRTCKDVYIADSYTDVVYIYKNDGTNCVISSFSDPSWKQSYVGPYGIDVADDGQVYVAIWADDNVDENGDGIPDNALWRCTPNGKNLKRVCYLPDYPRGLKVIGGGANTVVYVSGTFGNVIRCTPVNANLFRAEILFSTGIIMNQQDVVPNHNETVLYVSSWTGWTPHSSAVTKWDHFGMRDDNFSVSYLEPGNVPGISLSNTEDALYVFHICLWVTMQDAMLYKVDPGTGQEKASVYVSPRGGYGGGGMNVDRRGSIYFSRTQENRDGFLISSWGKVTDLTLLGKQGDNTATISVTSPESFTLFQNHPNPFNPDTEIRFQIPEANHVVLKIFNATGQAIRILTDSQYEAGYHSVRWNGKDESGMAVSSGVYLCRIQAGNFSQVRKMNLLR